MSTVRRVQYGVPGGADSGDPAAGASKPRVVVTEETGGDADRFEELLDGDATRTADAEAEARRRAAARTSDLDRERRLESEAPADDEAPRDEPTPDDDGPTPAERSREDAAAEEAQGASAGDVETMVESRETEEADGSAETADASKTDDGPAEPTVGSGIGEEAGAASPGVVPTSGGEGGERHSVAPPITATGHAGEHQRRHDGSTGLDAGDEAAAAAAAAAQQPPPAALAGAGMEPPAVEKAPDTAPQAVVEIARQVADQLAVRQATPGASAQVRIRLRDDVLSKTSLVITMDGDTVQVTVTTGSSESAALVEAHASDLAAAIAGRTGKAAQVRYRDQSGAACAVDADLPAAAEPGVAMS